MAFDKYSTAEILWMARSHFWKARDLARVRFGMGDGRSHFWNEKAIAKLTAV
ncbi:hypothetical protein [Microcoleus sp. bin38.metabat.b11b12b14.051]|uniref:hypothetical protein n=1 Tax=Microcoleus sp. bin38.metabat.b11b12b14.051 TaxID=2742709 RepID=UPI0025F3D053|nr:hypothetical protein [Microcoleus sp. bin38.metabat.b11b12b14.051]